MDFKKRCSLERFARPLPILPNVPPTIWTMGAGRCLAPGAETLARNLEERGDLGLSECFIDGTSLSLKRGTALGKTKRGKGRKLLALADASGFPIAIHLESAAPHEVTLIHATLEQ